MGLDPQNLPDALLRRISPADRRSARLPPPLSELVSHAKAKSELRLEKELQNQIANFLRLRGITYIQSRMDKPTRNQKGTTDFLFAIKGRAVAIEAKLPGKQPTEEQRRFMAALARDGWAVKVVCSLDEVRYFIAALL